MALTRQAQALPRGTFDIRLLPLAWERCGGSVRSAHKHRATYLPLGVDASADGPFRETARISEPFP